MTCVDGCALQIRPDMLIVEAAGKWILPGLIDSHAPALGPEPAPCPGKPGEAGGLAADPITVPYQARLGISPESPFIPQARVAGITSALVVPSGASADGAGGFIMGESALIDLAGTTVDTMLVKSPVGLHVNLGDSATGRNEAKGGKGAAPASNAARLHQALVDAPGLQRPVGCLHPGASRQGEAGARTRCRACQGPAEGASPAGAARRTSPDRARPPRRRHPDGNHDLRRVLDPHDSRPGTEAYKVADELFKRRIPVLVGPVTTEPAHDGDAGGDLRECREAG